MPAGFDAMPFTVMSYRSYVGGSTSGGYTNETWGYTQSLMMLDIAAVQHLYGANFTTRSGDTVYSWSPTTGQGFVDGMAQSAPGATAFSRPSGTAAGSTPTTSRTTAPPLR